MLSMTSCHDRIRSEEKFITTLSAKFVNFKEFTGENGRIQNLTKIHNLKDEN